jgi:hypothetical protein
MAANKKFSERDRAAQAKQKKAFERDQRLLAERERHAQAECDRVAAEQARVERRKKWLGSAWKIPGGLITLFGIYTGVIGLQSRISIGTDSAIDPSNVFTAPFIVSNDGSLDLHDLSYWCLPVKVLSPSTGMTLESRGPYPEKLGGMQYKSMAIDVLPATGKHTFTCPMPFAKTAVTFADIIISVSYRPSWWPFTRQVHKHFETPKGDDKPTKFFEMPMPK